MAILHYMIVTTQINNGNCPTLHDSLYRFVMELLILHWGRRGRDHIVVGFTTTCAISAYHNLSCEFEPRSWRSVPNTTSCDKFVSDLRQVGGFLRVLRFPPPIKLTATI
jgi:hypothetical protein